MGIVAFARFLGEEPRRLGHCAQAKPAGGADNILGQARRLVPFFLGAGLCQRIGQFLGGDNIALQDFNQRLHAH